MQAQAIVHAQSLQDFFDLGILFGMVGIRYIRNEQDQSGLLHFFQCGAKCSDQSWGKIANETYRIGKQDAPVRWQTHGTHGRIERREHFGRDEHTGAAQGVKQRGFPGIRVSHQRDRAERHRLARLPPQRALLPNRFYRFSNFTNAVTDAPTVGFDFLLAGSARADAAGLPGKFLCASGEPRQHVIELCEFDLKLPFPAACVPRKNVEDELRAIDHAAIGAALQVAQLRRSQVAIENHQLRFVKLRLDLHFLDLAAADDGSGIDLVTHLKNASGNLGARAAGQFRELGKRSALRFTRVHTLHMRCPFQAHTNQEYAFA